jgi:hypothetical protein
MTRLVPICLVILMACVCSESYGQQQGSGDPQDTEAPAQTGKTTPSKLPPVPPNVLFSLTPTQAQVNESQGPALSAAPEVSLPPEKGFAGLPPASGSFSISDHDLDKGKDILGDLIERGLKDQGFDVPLSADSAFTDALESVAKKMGASGVSGLASDFLEGGGILMDSEPIATNALVYPDTVRYGQSVLSNLGSVAGGNPSPFNDQDLIQACNRLRSYFTLNQFNLDAVAQSQLQQVLAANCSQQVGGIGAPVVSPNGSVSPRVAPTPPQTPSTKAKPGSCGAPGAKICH